MAIPQPQSPASPLLLLVASLPAGGRRATIHQVVNFRSDDTRIRLKQDCIECWAFVKLRLMTISRARLILPCASGFLYPCHFPAFRPLTSWPGLPHSLCIAVSITSPADASGWMDRPVPTTATGAMLGDHRHECVAGAAASAVLVMLLLTVYLGLYLAALCGALSGSE